MNNWFSTKLQEEDNLYKEYMLNLDNKGINSNDKEYNLEESEIINKYLDSAKRAY